MTDKELSRPVLELGAAEPLARETPHTLMQLAIEKGANMEQLEKLMELQERWEANQARKAFDAAMAAAKASIGPVLKHGKVDFTSSKGRTSYSYERLEDVERAVAPALSENGLSYRFRSQQENQLLTVTCIVAHEAGHYEEISLSGPPDMSGNKNPYQSVGSAATYLQRYTLKLALGLSAAADDDAQEVSNKPAPPVIDGSGSLTEQQIRLLKAKLEANNKDEDDLFDQFGGRICDLHAGDINKVLAWIQS